MEPNLPTITPKKVYKKTVNDVENQIYTQDNGALHNAPDASPKKKNKHLFLYPFLYLIINQLLMFCIVWYFFLAFGVNDSINVFIKDSVSAALIIRIISIFIVFGFLLFGAIYSKKLGVNYLLLWRLVALAMVAVNVNPMISDFSQLLCVANGTTPVIYVSPLQPTSMELSMDFKSTLSVIVVNDGDEENVDGNKPKSVDSTIMKIQPQGATKKLETTQSVETVEETSSSANSSISPSSFNVFELFTIENGSEQNETDKFQNGSADANKYNNEDSMTMMSIDEIFNSKDNFTIANDKKKKKRSINDEESMVAAWLIEHAMVICSFASLGLIIIGNLLMGYKCGSTKVKSCLFGLSLTIINLLALFPSKIAYDQIMLLILSENSEERGNCNFLIFIIVGAIVLSVISDTGVWYLVKKLVLCDKAEPMKKNC